MSTAELKKEIEDYRERRNLEISNRRGINRVESVERRRSNYEASRENIIHAKYKGTWFEQATMINNQLIALESIKNV